MTDDALLLSQVKSALHSDARLGRCRIEPNGNVPVPVLYPEGCAGHIRVRVLGGTVTLAGEVESAAERALAESLVRSIAGTKVVLNALSIGPCDCRCTAAPVARR
jgi:hypothetical protein